MSITVNGRMTNFLRQITQFFVKQRQQQIQTIFCNKKFFLLMIEELFRFLEIHSSVFSALKKPNYSALQCHFKIQGEPESLDTSRSKVHLHIIILHTLYLLNSTPP